MIGNRHPLLEEGKVSGPLPRGQLCGVTRPNTGAIPAGFRVTHVGGGVNGYCILVGPFRDYNGVCAERVRDEGNHFGGRIHLNRRTDVCKGARWTGHRPHKTCQRGIFKVSLKKHLGLNADIEQTIVRTVQNPKIVCSVNRIGYNVPWRCAEGFQCHRLGDAN